MGVARVFEDLLETVDGFLRVVVLMLNSLVILHRQLVVRCLSEVKLVLFVKSRNCQVLALSVELSEVKIGGLCVTQIPVELLLVK